MTMIACTMNKAAPVIIGDLLVSDSVKPDQFVISTLTEYRDLFVLACLTGLRFSDFSNLRPEDRKPPR